MDPVIAYVFGTGDGALSHWTSPADLDLNGDGIPDAVALDFDGDGLLDDAMWDSDGNGTADLALLDLDDDGHREAQFRDGGRGLWEVEDPAEHRPSDHRRPGSGPFRETSLDTDGDGVDDLVLVDADGDGYADSYRESTSMG
ncbi:hypothetical protein [Gordonia sp. (in: high G+C Gram-positive bacteria)]|uniref:hypothetical protein n=1 Tax=Gordonia sp. (in: high G+C Gram-positive bacteria) TaxID=84139 RepID=UPI003C76D0CA